ENWPSTLIAPVMVMFCAFCSVLGTYQASMAFREEIRNNTWDFQRMSSIGPWQLAGGKFLGVTSYAWYVGILLLVVVTVACMFLEINIFQHLRQPEVPVRQKVLVRTEHITNAQIYFMVCFMVLVALAGQLTAYLLAAVGL